MKVTSICTVLLSTLVSVQALESLSEYAKDIPKCSWAALAKAMKTEGCDTSKVNSDTMNCLCKHISAIAVLVQKDVSDSATCFADFTQSAASMCGMWEADGTTATDLAAATSVLAAELAGQSAGGSGKTTAAGSGTGTAAANTAANTAASTSKNLAAAPTVGVIGLVGGAAAAVAGMMM